MSKFKNTKSINKLTLINSLTSLDGKDDKLSKRCKFNFHYFSPSDGGQDFKELTQKELEELLEKLSHYSEQSIQEWKNDGTLVIYKDFPEKISKFKKPKHVPIEVHWGRFRMTAKSRLVGFVIPPEKNNEEHNETKFRFDCNTFYIVFYDKEHEFYPVEKK